MFSLSDRVPGYLLGKYQLIATVTFTALFSIVAILLTVPFSGNFWFDLGTVDVSGFTVAFFLLSLFVVILSKRLLYSTYKGRPETMTYMQYILWDFIEIFVISIIYTAFTVKGSELGAIDLGSQSTDHVFFNSLVWCLMSLGVPYVCCGMYFAIIDKNNTIRVMNYANVVSDNILPPQEEKKITLFDNSGLLKLCISSTNLYYLESDDNYIIVWYTDSSGVLKQYMLRCRLKTVEDSFIGSSLVRCHRKYIVNMDHVKVLRRVKDSYVLDLDNDAIPPIQTTKTYEENILALFNSSRPLDQ